MELLQKIAENIKSGDAESLKNNIKQALDKKIDAEKILKDGMMQGMNIVGEKFKREEIFVPEVLVSARAMNMGMEVLEPELADIEVEAEGKVILGTVKGDLHDIGKNLVAMMLAGGGFDVVDLGVDIKAEEFVSRVQKEEPDILGLSALLTTTMEEMKGIIDILKEEGLYEEVGVLVGGAPVTEEFAEEIGAFYAADAGSAVETARKIVKA